MRILYINHYAGGPRYGMEFRPYYLAREWVRAGHEVLIVAASFSHVRSKQPSVPRQPLQESEDGIRYLWYPTPAYAGNGVGRVRNIVTFLGWLYRDGKRIARSFQPDVVIASSTYPMDIWPARRIAKQAKARLVFEVHDLWPLSPIEIGGMSPKHPFIRVCQAAENTAYRQADLVVSMLPKVRTHALSKGLPIDRLAVVPNGFALDDWQGTKVIPLRADLCEAIKGAHAAGERVVAYTGSLGLPNAIDTLLDAAALLQDEPLRFILVGDGHERERLKNRIQVEKLVRVEIFDPVPKAQIATLLGAVDMAYLGAPRQSIYRFGVSPNKMIDYMMARVPILYAIEAGNDPIAEAGCGVSLPAENAAALATAIRHLATLEPEHLKTMGDNGRRYAMEHHAYDVLAAAFLTAVDRVTVRS